jgi:multidrug efflux pump subunit AcrA (membrane-fusion protein)
LVESEADRDQTARESRRTAQIHSQSPELVSAQEVESAQSRADQAAARTGSARARVDAAAAALRVAEATLENTYIRAPFTGTVLRKEAEVGEVVAPSVGGGLTRGAVVTMADLASLEVEVDVNEAYIGRVSHGQGARITLDAYPDTSFRGEVRQVVPTADRQRATVQVKVSILDRDPESAAIALIGGLVGCLLALPMNGIVTSTTNWANFSEIGFSFRITPGLLLAGVVFAVVMGTLGGFFPARRASKVPVAQAIR